MNSMTKIYGHIRFLKHQDEFIQPLSGRSSKDQLDAFNQALIDVRKDIETSKTLLMLSNPVLQDILTFYQTILSDPVMIEAVVELIEHSLLTAPSAVDAYFSQQVTNLFEHNLYFQARKEDLLDVKNRLLNALYGNYSKPISIKFNHEPTLLVCDRLWVYELAKMDLKNVKAVVCQEGSTHSHVAIILASYGIPFFINPLLDQSLQEGDFGFVDAETGQLFKSSYSSAYIQPILKTDDLKELVGGIELWPAINLVSELEGNFPKNLTGIGLIRTELLYMGRPFPPDEIEQILYYQSISQKTNGKKVYYRLLDVERDKPLSYVDQLYQGAEFLLHHPEMTLTQIKALSKIGHHYPIGIMIPMVKKKAEIDQIWQWFASLNSDEIPIIDKGIMIETAEAIEAIDQFKDLDFMMLGTNDLASAFTKTNRVSTALKDENYLNPEMIRAIDKVIKHCHAQQIPLILCGDAANRMETVLLYLALGVRRFAPALNHVKMYHHLSIKTLESIASIREKLITSKTAQEIHFLLEPFLHY